VAIESAVPTAHASDAASGRVDVKRLVTHRFALERAEAALRLADSPADGVIKAMVEVA